MKEIPLVRDLVTLVDDRDYPRLSKHNWQISGVAPYIYAARYPRRGGKSVCVLMHREILDAPKGMHVDHINGDRLDNRRENLRLCTHAQNGRNRKPTPGGSSKYKGVKWDRRAKKWRATIKINRKEYHLGYFTSETEAALAYDRGALKHHKEFARTNFQKKHP